MAKTNIKPPKKTRLDPPPEAEDAPGNLDRSDDSEKKKKSKRRLSFDVSEEFYWEFKEYAMHQRKGMIEIFFEAYAMHKSNNL